MVHKLVYKHTKFYDIDKGFPSWIDTFDSIKICERDHSLVSKWRQTQTSKTKEKFMIVYPFLTCEESTFPTLVK